jgi:trimethylamine:corrinoid methyltransferase-like protein
MNAANDGLRTRYFSDDQIGKIHSYAVDLMTTRGFMIDHRGGLEMPRDSGARLNSGTQVVRIGSDLVRACTSTAVSRLRLGARDPSRYAPVETHVRSPICRNSGGADKIIDSETAPLRDMDLGNIANLYRAFDALDFIAIVSPLCPQDISERARDLVATEILSMSTSKTC